MIFKIVACIIIIYMYYFIVHIHTSQIWEGCAIVEATGHL